MGLIQRLPNYYSQLINQAICILLFCQLYLVILFQQNIIIIIIIIIWVAAQAMRLSRVLEVPGSIPGWSALICGARVATIQLDVPSMTTVSVAGWSRDGN